MPVAAVLWSPSVAQAHVAALYALPSPAALFPRSRPGLAACPAEHAASALQAEAAARRALLLFDSAPRLADAACSVWVGEQPSLGRPLGARGCLGAAPLPEQPAVCTSSSAPAACGSACVLSSAEAAASRPDGEAPSASMSASARLLQCGPAAHTSAERSVTAAAPAAAIPAVALAAAAAAAAAAAEAEAAATAAAARARSDPSAAAAVLRSLAAPRKRGLRGAGWDAPPVASSTLMAADWRMPCAASSPMARTAAGAGEDGCGAPAPAGDGERGGPGSAAGSAAAAPSGCLRAGPARDNLPAVPRRPRSSRAAMAVACRARVRTATVAVPHDASQRCTCLAQKYHLRCHRAGGVHCTVLPGTQGALVAMRQGTSSTALAWPSADSGGRAQGRSVARSVPDRRDGSPPAQVGGKRGGALPAACPQTPPPSAEADACSSACPLAAVRKRSRVQAPEPAPALAPAAACTGDPTALACSASQARAGASGRSAPGACACSGCGPRSVMPEGHRHERPQAYACSWQHAWLGAAAGGRQAPAPASLQRQAAQAAADQQPAGNSACHAHAWCACPEAPGSFHSAFVTPSYSSSL
jgi:hypothetical protein